MAESSKPVNKKKGLPPISPRTENEGDEAKPVRKRVKKKTTKAESNGDVTEITDTQEMKPEARKRKKRAQSQNRESGPEPISEPPVEGGVSITPKKKKKKKPQSTEDGAEVQGSTQNGEGDTGPKKDVQGSKTSLLSKDGETPRKKVVKKKKKVKKSPPADDEYGESPWAEDLRTLADDILPGSKDVTDKEEERGDAEDKEEELKQSKLKTTFLTGPMLKSQPMDKIYVESANKFRGLNKTVLSKQIAEEHVKASVTPVVTRKTTIDFALTSHQLFRVISLFLHGLTAGLCLWQMVSIFTLTTFSTTDFLTHYEKTSMPLQCSLYFLLALCMVSACDRFDIGNPTPLFIKQAFTLQNGALSIVFYLVALILNVVTIKFEDEIYLYEEQSSTSTNDTMSDDDIDNFKSLNTARCIFAILGWFVLSITPNEDRLGKNLKSGETGLETELQMNGMSSA